MEPRARSLPRAVDFLAPLGLALIVGAFAWQRAWGLAKPLPGYPRWWVLAGVGLMLAHLVLRWDDIAAQVGRRQMRYGTNTAVLAAAVLAILAGLNYLANRRHQRWDLTKSERHSLSDQTRKILASLKEDVTIIHFFDRSANRMESGRDRLEQFRQASPRVKVVYVDPLAEAARTRAYQVTVVPTLVVEQGPRRERINTDSEQDIAGAIVRVTRTAKKTVCFAEGEGEHDIDDGARRGYSTVKMALERSQYATRKVMLARTGSVPAECTVLVVPGPQTDLPPRAAQLIRSWVKSGGKLLLMLEPPLGETTPNLTGLLAEWNLEAGHDLIIDATGEGGGPEAPVARDYPYHDTTKDLRGIPTVFYTARSVQAGTAGKEGVVTQNLVQTGPFPESWAESDLANLTGQVSFQEGKDKRGPVSLAAVATLSASALAALPTPVESPAASPSPGTALEPAITGTVVVPPSPVASPSPGESPSAEVPSPEPTSPALASPAAGASPAPEAPAPSASPAAAREARVAVFGDSDFVSNMLPLPSNFNLFLNTVAWLALDAELISLREREPDDQRLFLPPQQRENIWLVSHLLLPGAFVVLGVASWWRRRA